MRRIIAVLLAWLMLVAPVAADIEGGTVCDCGGLCGSWTVTEGSTYADCAEFCGACNNYVCNAGEPSEYTVLAASSLGHAHVCGCECSDGDAEQDTSPLAWDDVCCGGGPGTWFGACEGMGTCQNYCDCNDDDVWECEGDDCGCSCDVYCLECDCDGDMIFTSPGCGLTDVNGDFVVDCADACCVIPPGGPGDPNPPCYAGSCISSTTGECFTGGPNGGCDVDGDGICDGIANEDGDCANCACTDPETGALNPAGYDADGDGVCDLDTEELAGDCCNLAAEIESRIEEFKEIFTGVIWPEEMSLEEEEWEDYCFDFELPWFGGTTETFEICLMPDTSDPLGVAFENFRLVARGIISGVFALMAVGKVWTVLRQY